ncbi:MAG: division/cell wall cluster transcriptional repressor MraZ [Acidimicrobiales bacterium]
MARFFGTYEHMLDAKGRVILPARFRTAFDSKGFLTQNHDGCLALWTPDQFEKQMEDRESRESEGRTERNAARLWASTSHEVEVDRQGRMAIPGRLRDFAGLQQNVLVMGIINRVELWDPTRWDEKIGPEELRLSQGLDD